MQRLLREACGGDAPGLRPLPDEVCRLLVAVEASPRLGAHLRAVHEVACQLLVHCEALWPGLIRDPDAVRFGAAVHDVGKVLHPEELSAPGSRHEQAGYRLLLGRGIDERLARFAATHADWQGPGVEVEDLVVSLADKAWKGHRVTDLEDRLLDAVGSLGGQERWDSFLQLDDTITRLAEQADERLAFQSGYPITF